jgi:cell division protein FtsI (penicillin-binding protein 3)
MDTSAIAFGHGISVSAIQLITAVSAIANNGVRMKPYIVQAVTDPTGRYVETRTPEPAGRAISEQTASIVQALMRSVVMADGTGKQAALEGYSVCGKTGTARKVDDKGEYMTDAHLASFVGFVPYGNPQLAILVVIDEPQGKYYGGAVAAPVFREIAREALSYLNIPPQPVQEQLTALKESGKSG